MARPARRNPIRLRRLRWCAPLATGAAIAVVAALPGLSAAATPSLPAVTPQQLLAKVQQADVNALSGTLNLTTNLGIPDLSALGDATSGGGQGQGRHGGQSFNPIDLLSGSHKALVWFSGPEQSRVALLQDMAETDVVHNGQNVWTWDSTTKKVTHYTLTGAAPATAGHAQGSDHQADGATPEQPVKTPQQVADDLVAHLSPSTAVSVGTPVRVAGRSAYQLLLAPHAAASTVAQVAIAVDGATGLPLQVEVFAKGQKSAAVKLGFGSISFSTPAASRFSFTPPPGSTVTNKTVNPHSSADQPAPATSRAKSGATSGAKTGATSGAKTGAKTGATSEAKPDHPASSEKQTTLGQDWTTVAVIGPVNIPPQLQQYLNAGASVSGTFGQGRLLSTSLVNVLVLNDGRVAIGAVNASTLEAAVAATP